MEIDQEVEIHYLPKGESNKSNNATDCERDQNIVEHSGPAQELDFADCDNNCQNSDLQRPTPVLPSSHSTHHKGKDSGSAKDKQDRSKQSKPSAFSKVVKGREERAEDKSFPGEKELGEYLLIYNNNMESSYVMQHQIFSQYYLFAHGWTCSLIM